MEARGGAEAAHGRGEGAGRQWRKARGAVHRAIERPEGAGSSTHRRGRARRPAGAPRPEGERPLAPPAVRLRAKEAGVDLRQVPGTGPAGRITHDDLDAFIARGRQPAAAPACSAAPTVEEIKVVGLRRRIAEKMALAKSRIPHITYVEEVDVTALEELRARLNAEKRADRPRLTILPFLMRAMVKAIGEQPEINAHFDDEAGIIRRHGGIHIGIATQTERRADGPGGAPCRGARPLGLRGRGRPPRRGRPGRHRDPRGAHRLDHHDHLARRAWAAS